MTDEDAMRLALAQAQIAAEQGETPVGAVIIDPATGQVVAAAGNGPIGAHDPTAHAEIAAIRAAGLARGNYRLTGLTLVVTLEPCAMCAGAISHARLGRLVFGAQDPKGGAVVHGPRFFEQPTCHWRPAVTGGVLGDVAGSLLRFLPGSAQGVARQGGLAGGQSLRPGQGMTVAQGQGV